MKKILITLTILVLLFLAYTLSHLFFNSTDQQIKSEIITYLEVNKFLNDCDCNERNIYIQNFGNSYFVTIVDKGIHDDSVSSSKKKFTLQMNNNNFTVKSQSTSSSCSRGKIWFGSQAGWCK